MNNFLLAFLFEVSSFGYEPLKDQNWIACDSNNFVADYDDNYFIVNYKICYQELGAPTEQEIETTTQKIFEFAKKNGLSGSQCSAIEDLEIYKISTEMLNDKNRFSDWSNNDSKKIWGLYDPRISETGVSSIMITDHGTQWNKIIFAHELSHYWYDRFCWNKTWTKSDEQFALDFELYFSK